MEGGNRAQSVFLVFVFRQQQKGYQTVTESRPPPVPSPAQPVWGTTRAPSQPPLPQGPGLGEAGALGCRWPRHLPPQGGAGVSRPLQGAGCITSESDCELQPCGCGFLASPHPTLSLAPCPHKKPRSHWICLPGGAPSELQPQCPSGSVPSRQRALVANQSKRQPRPAPDAPGEESCLHSHKHSHESWALLSLRLGQGTPNSNSCRLCFALFHPRLALPAGGALGSAVWPGSRCLIPKLSQRHRPPGRCLSISTESSALASLFLNHVLMPRRHGTHGHSGGPSCTPLPLLPGSPGSAQASLWPLHTPPAGQSP